MTTQSQAHKRQGDKLVSVLKKRGMTIMEMLSLNISTCPWKRVAECVPDGHRLDKTGRRGRLVVYRVVKG